MSKMWNNHLSLNSSKFIGLSMYLLALLGLQTWFQLVNPFTLRISLSNSPYCLSYNSYDVSLENLVPDQLIIP